MVENLGGMAQKRQLVRLGARDSDLTAAVRSGEVARARQGWYTTLDRRSPAVQAVRVGGRLTGLSAIRELGGWMFQPAVLHVSVPANAARLRARTNRHRALDVTNTRGVVLHWESRELQSTGTAVAVGLRDALVRVILDESVETAVAVLDWAARAGLLDEFDRAELAASLPRQRRGPIAAIDEKCESFPESLARTRLRAAGHDVRSQVLIEGTNERIDLLIDERIGLEIDGRQFHAHTFERDSAKAVRIALGGWIPLRCSASLVMHDWDTVLRALDTLLGNSGVVPAPAHRDTGMSPRRSGRRAATPEFPRGAGGRPPRGAGMPRPPAR